MAEEFLDLDEAKEITDEVIKLFSEELNESLNSRFAIFSTKVKNILNTIELEEKIQLNRENKQTVVYNANISDVKVRKAAFEGYLLIMQFREFLFNEVVDYRYYYDAQVNKKNVSKMISFKDSELYKYIKFGEEGIKLHPTALKSDYNTNNSNDLYNKYMTMFYNEFMSKKYMTASKSPGYYVVTEDIFNEYSKKNPGLHQKDKEDVYQLFNRGHVYENLDTSLTQLYNIENKKPTYTLMKNRHFGKFLKRDTIIASQGGDNPITNTSIKSNKANLYKYKTIVDQLKIIDKILDGKMKTKKELSLVIKPLFLSEEKYKTKKEINILLNNSIDLILNNLTKTVK